MPNTVAGNDVLRPPSFDESARMAARLTRSPMAAISLLGETCQWFKAEVGLGIDATPIEQAFCKHTAALRQVMVIPDALLDERFATNPLVTSGTIRAYAGAPLLLDDGTAIGAVCVLDTEPREFDDRDTELLELLATQVVAQLKLEALIDQQANAIADLENVRLELKFAASHDPLTRLLNRRGFEAELNRLIAETSTRWKEEAECSLLFLDLDGFKQINDQHGHIVGDSVLIEVAKRITMACPGEAILARFGGDEFVAASVTPAGRNPCETHLDALLADLARPIAVDGRQMKLTASAGIAREPVRSLRAGELIDQADRAMFVAKKHGGGCSRIWTRHLADASERTRERHRLGLQPVLDLVRGRTRRRYRKAALTADS